MEALDLALLDGFQRDLPLVARPFAAIGQALAIPEAEVLARLTRLQSQGLLARVGATVRPGTAGASTLCAMAVAEDDIDRIAALVGAEPGVNHSYLREDRWNLWFVATAPGAGALQATLTRLRLATGQRLLDLPILRAFNIDLGFRLDRPAPMQADRPALPHVFTPEDRALLQRLTDGLPLIPRPFAPDEAATLKRLRVFLDKGILTRLGLILRHRNLGYQANAMVVWDIDPQSIARAGPALAALPGITLCYQRRPDPLWPYELYSMIHARSRPEALAILDRAAALPELSCATPRPLFSTRCFKQTGALLRAA